MAGETNDFVVARAIGCSLECPPHVCPGRFAAKTRRWKSPRHSLYKTVVLHSHRSAPARLLPGQSRARAWGVLMFLVALAPALLAPPLATAAPPPASASGSGAQATAGKSAAKAPAKSSSAGTGSGGSSTSGGKKVISLDDEFLVEGQLEKPSAFYVLRRSSTDYDWARLDATMTPLVLESVWDPLF